MKRRTRISGFKKHQSLERLETINRAWQYLTPFQRGLLSLESFSARTAALDEKIRAEENRAAHEEVEAERRRLTRQMLTASLGKHAAHLPDWLARADPAEVNRILHLLLEKIVVYEDRIELVYAE